MMLQTRRSAPLAVLPGVLALAAAVPAAARWAPRPIPGPTPRVDRAVVAHPTDPQVLLAIDTGRRAWRSVDGGVTWTRILEEAQRVAFARSEPSRVYAVRHVDEVTPMLVSHDGAITFEQLPFPQTPDDLTPELGYIHLDFGALVVDPFDADTVYAADTRHLYTGGVLFVDTGHLWKTTDGGQSWEQLTTEAAPPAVDPFDSSRVYQWTPLGLRISRDGGRTFEPTGNLPELFRARHIAIDPFRPGGLWLAGDHQVMRSDDGGETFLPAEGGLPAGRILSLTADPVRPDTVWVVADGHGPWVSRDRGRTWSPARGDTEPARFAGPLAVGADGRLWAGALGGLLELDGELPCAATGLQLCLRQGRFRVEAQWQDFQGASGAAHALDLTTDSGGFWFFDPANLELTVKILDGGPVNGHFWVFLGSMSNVGFEVTVTDTATGRVWRRENPSGTFASLGDVQAFPTSLP